MENPWRMDLTEIRKLFNLFAHIFLKQSYPYRAITNTEDISNEPKAVDVTTGEGITAIQRRNEELPKFCLLITISDSFALWFSNNDSLAWKTMVPRITDGAWHNDICPYVITSLTHSSTLQPNLVLSYSFDPFSIFGRHGLLKPENILWFGEPEEIVTVLETLLERSKGCINNNAPNKDPTIATAWENARLSSRLFGQPTWTAVIAFDPG